MLKRFFVNLELNEGKFKLLKANHINLINRLDILEFSSHASKNIYKCIQ